MNIKNMIAYNLVGMTLCINASVVSNVNVSNRYPWNGMVDIRFNLGQDAAVSLTAKDKVGNTNLAMRTLSEAGVMIQNGLTSLPKGDRHVVWNAATDYPNVVFEDVEILVTVDEELYMVISLTKSGDKYPVSYLAGVPKSGWPIEYKTKSLVLRKIKAGSFTIGSPESEWGRNNNEAQSRQTIAKDFYIGIYEVTFGQLWKVIAHNSSNYGWSPEYPAIEGGKAETFVSTLRTGSGLSVSLPTHIQWEYACRAGTTTALYTGKNPADKYELRIELAGRENFNDGGAFDRQIQRFGGDPTVVGSFLPNPWGLYDMYGNRGELCADGVCKGGSSHSDDKTARSAYRGTSTPSNHSSDYLGFRIVVNQ